MTPVQFCTPGVTKLNLLKEATLKGRTTLKNHFKEGQIYLAPTKKSNNILIQATLKGRTTLKNPKIYDNPRGLKPAATIRGPM